MATAGAAEPSSEVFLWLKNLPTAPVYHPTLAEFQDPISYIFKIEKEASRYGICKIVPPVPAPAKKTAITQLNRSLAARSADSTPKSPKTTPTFTTRQQQIGFCPRRHRPVQKPVWQSGEQYTFQEFEAKAKNFEKSYLKRSARKPLSPLEIETLFWKACVDKPFSVEYANDMPGSAFAPFNSKKLREAGDAVSVGETPWNMRGVARAKGSLLRFMKEDIPGVTSPMVYVAMMFSWFAWHVEDHDLHSLNYLHMGAGKTWYGVPRDAAVAFEEVVRVEGYGGEINPLVTFAILGEKTTVMSPEVFVNEGIPCCRLVQNAGEFVVTFPRAYHCGFSHGFNCGEASNIATPEWLRFAKDAAIRRASVNHPPMVSHLQLLYDLGLALCSSLPMSVSHEPRSSRLKDKKKGEGETLTKKFFVQNVIENNDLLHILGKGSPVVLFPENSPEISALSRSHLKLKSRLSLGLCTPEEGIRASKSSVSDEIMVNKNQGIQKPKVLYPVKGLTSLSARNMLTSVGTDDTLNSQIQTQSAGITKENGGGSDRLPGYGLFSCVTCGVLSYACYAIVHPKEAAARYLMSADCSYFNDWNASSGVTRDGFNSFGEDGNASVLNLESGYMEESDPEGLYDVPIQSGSYQIQETDDFTKLVLETEKPVSKTKKQEKTSALGLLALTYAHSSDSEDDGIEADVPFGEDETNQQTCSPDSISHFDYSELPSPKEECHSGPNRGSADTSCGIDSENIVPCEIIDPYWGRGPKDASIKGVNPKMFGYPDDFEADIVAPVVSSSPENMIINSQVVSDIPSSFSPVSCNDERMKFNNAIVSLDKANIPVLPRSDEDSSRVHVFCLEHAVEVEQHLRAIGGANVLLVCTSDYPKVEAEAKSLADELGISHGWNDIPYREAAKEDADKIQSALDSEVAIPGNGDWAVKLGINLYYSAILSGSPLYSKQMPYNSVMYKAFGRISPASSPRKFDEWKGSGKQKKIVMAGKWCGKVWMSNQVHPFLVARDHGESEPDRSYAWPKADEKPEIKSETTCKSEAATVARKNGRKRKMTTEDHPIKKAKSPQTVEVAGTSDDAPDGDSVEQNRRVLRSRPIKPETPELKKKQRKNSTKLESPVDEDLKGGPSTRLRKRMPKPSKETESKVGVQKEQMVKKKVTKSPGSKIRVSCKNTKVKDEEGEHQCDMEGCGMSFNSKLELATHKRNICPVKGCGKKFFSHKYLLQHRRVHDDIRPLKCPWRGCKMTFKWAWARTEHIRVHTGARPYTCNEAGCGQTFRFVSDFSRHKRKTGHSARKSKR